MIPSVHNAMFLRICDSRNLNLSPFCYMTAKSLAKWQPVINSTYGNTEAEYIKRLQIIGPLRLKYPGQSKEEELLASLTEVVIHPNLSITSIIALLRYFKILGSSEENYNLQSLWITLFL